MHKKHPSLWPGLGPFEHFLGILFPTARQNLADESNIEQFFDDSFSLFLTFAHDHLFNVRSRRTSDWVRSHYHMILAGNVVVVMIFNVSVGIWDQLSLTSDFLVSVHAHALPQICARSSGLSGLSLPPSIFSPLLPRPPSPLPTQTLSLTLYFPLAVSTKILRLSSPCHGFTDHLSYMGASTFHFSILSYPTLFRSCHKYCFGEWRIYITVHHAHGLVYRASMFDLICLMD